MATLTTSWSSKLLNSKVHYLNEVSADVFFVCGSNEATERIPAHKIILAMNSDTFTTMFYGSLPEKGDVTISDATPNGFREFLRYFYFSEYTPNLQFFREAMTLSRKYLIEHYFNDCCAFLEQQQTAEGMIFAYCEILWFNLPHLRKTMEANLFKYSDKILSSKYLYQIDSVVLKRIIQIQEMDPKGILDACMAWSKETCERAKLIPTMENRREQLGDCFECIEFSGMSTDEIIECMEQFDGLFTVQELQRLLVIVGSQSDGNIIEEYDYECKVGKKTELRVNKPKDSQEELQFTPRVRVVLSEISMTVLCDDNARNFDKLSVSLVKIPASKNIRDGIVLHKSSRLSEGKMWMGNIILRPKSVYVIQISFKDKCYYDACDMIALNDEPINVLPQTNAKLIESLSFLIPN